MTEIPAGRKGRFVTDTTAADERDRYEFYNDYTNWLGDSDPTTYQERQATRAAIRKRQIAADDQYSKDRG